MNPLSAKEVTLLAQTFPLCFSFAKNSTINTSVSKHLTMPDTEQCERPLYYTIQRVTYNGKMWISITYSLFFRVNPGYKVACWRAGYHPVDVERVVVLFDQFSGGPQHVFFGAHGRGQGVWQRYTDCDMHLLGDNQVPVLKVYVARESNAIYPNKKTYIRVFGFANDSCKGDGELWIPGTKDRCNASKQSWTSTHSQIAPGINSPSNITVPWTSSITNKQRFFLAFPFVRKRVIGQGEPLNVLEHF
jgi:hypothetical protein